MRRARSFGSPAFAKRLGTAGAWAAVLLALSGFAVSVLAVSRLRRRVLAPLEDLSATLQAAHHGDIHRRCQSWAGPLEIKMVLSGVNRLLDEHSQHRLTGETQTRLDRAVSLHLLDQLQAAAFVVGGRRDVLLSSRTGLAELAGSQGGQLRQELRRLPSTQLAPKGYSASRVQQLDLWLVQGNPEPGA